MRRRDFISLLGGTATWPLVARAQFRGKINVIGILAIEALPPIDTFREKLNELRYVEGKNVRFEHRYAKGRNDLFPTMANDLVALRVDVILTWGTDAVLAAKRAIVSNLARPEANVTGFSSLAAELEAKRLELLKEMVPRMSRVAVFSNPTNHYMPNALQSAHHGADMLHAALTFHEVSDITTLNAAFEKTAEGST